LTIKLLLIYSSTDAEEAWSPVRREWGPIAELHDRYRAAVGERDLPMPPNLKRMLGPPVRCDNGSTPLSQRAE
jgi:hypothetical protein